MTAPARWKRLKTEWAVLSYYQHDVSPGHLLGLAAITLALGVAYWLMRERDDRVAPGPQGDH